VFVVVILVVCILAVSDMPMILFQFHIQFGSSTVWWTLAVLMLINEICNLM